MHGHLPSQNESHILCSQDKGPSDSAVARGASQVPQHLLLMVQKSGDHQLRLVVYPAIERVLYIPGGAGSLPSTVLLGSNILQMFVEHTFTWQQNLRREFPKSILTPKIPCCVFRHCFFLFLFFFPWSTYPTQVTPWLQKHRSCPVCQIDTFQVANETTESGTEGRGVF